MRSFAFIGLWLMTGWLQAQTTTKFNTSVKAISSNEFMVENEIHFMLEEEMGMIPIEAIRYKNCAIEELAIDGNPAELISYTNLWKIEWYEKVQSPIRISYRVRSQEAFAYIPMLMLPWKPAGTPEDLFQANIKIPDDLMIQDQFPTIPFTALGGGQYAFELPVITSLIRLRLSKDDGFEWGRTQWIDALVVALLLGLGVLGWMNRHKMNS